MSLQDQLLERLHLLSAAHSDKRDDWAFKGFEDLVLAHGRFMPYKGLPESIEPTPIKECFSNSQDLVFSNPKLSYVEGYVTHERLPLVIPHAWTLNEEGSVIDPTWRLEGGTYFGIALNKAWLLDFLGDRIAKGKDNHRAVFEGNYQEGFSLLREGLPQEALAEPIEASFSFTKTISINDGNS